MPSKGKLRLSMGFPVSLLCSRSQVIAWWILPTLFRVLTFQRTRTSTERTLAGSLAFSARMGVGSHIPDGAPATTAVAAPRTEAEGTDIRA
jgi:hypothetical protein